MASRKGRSGSSRAPAGKGGLVDERVVERWVNDLRRLVVAGQVELYARVGEYLIEHIYGSVEEARSRRAGKAATIARLGQRATEFGMTAAGLTRAVPFALQVRELGHELSRGLGVRHHRALLPVKNPAEKKLLAEAAVDSGWSAEELKKKVRSVQGKHGGGRPAQPALVVLVRQLDRLLAKAKPALYRAQLPQIEASSARRLLGRVNAAQALLEKLEKLLTRAALA